MSEKTEDTEFESLRPYFDAKIWTELSDYEKTALKNRQRNYQKMLEMGIASQCPEFMRARPAPPAPRAKRRRAASASSDDEWRVEDHVRPARPSARSKSQPGGSGRASAAKAAKPAKSAKSAKFKPPVKKRAKSGPLPIAVRPPNLRFGPPPLSSSDPDSTPPTPPSPPDFLGFTEEDVEETKRTVIDARLALLWHFLVEEWRELGFAPPPLQEKKRARKEVNYQEEDDLDDDDYIFCDECDREWEGDCPKHGPLIVVTDTPAPAGHPQRDVKTLPEFLSTGKSKIQDANTGIWTEKDLPARMRFGPYEGTVTSNRSQATDSGYSWEIKKNRRVHHYIDAADPACSNWLRYVNCARFEQEQNVIAFQYKGQMYYRTYKPVAKGSELLVYYGDAYAKELDIDVRAFRKAPAAPAPSGNGGANILRCDHCSYHCLGPDMLDKHVKRKHGRVGRDGRYKCGMCTYSTNDSSSMSRHQITHTGERPFPCDKCNKAFTQQGNLTQHIRTVHAGLRPHSCDVCGKTFSLAAHLTTHQRIHTGTVVAQCEQCGKQFNDRSHYYTHMQSHDGVKAHKCQVCSARFVRRFELTIHMRTHTGERPYACPHCEARFNQLSHMKNHVIAVHTHDYRHRCQRCGKGFTKPSLLGKHSDKCLL